MDHSLSNYDTKNSSVKVSKAQTEIMLIDALLALTVEKLELFFTLPKLMQLEEGVGLLTRIVGEDTAANVSSTIMALLVQRQQLEPNPNSVTQPSPDEDDKLLFYIYNKDNIEALFNAYSPRKVWTLTNIEKRFFSAANDLFKLSKLRQLCSRLDMMTVEAKKVVGLIADLRNFVVGRMRLGPNEELEREQELWEMYQYSRWTRDEIEVLTRRFSRAMDQQARKISKNCKEARQTQARTDAANTHANQMARFFGMISENKMTWARKKSEYIQEHLSSEMKTLELTFDSLLSSHLTKERAMRVKRYKTEQQLLSVLKKYDEDVKDRDKTYKDLMDVFLEEQEQLRILQEKFDEQEAQYNALMDEKDEYERQLWEERLYQVQMIIAARKIQRYYRMYVALCKSNGFQRFKRGKGKRGRK